MKNLRIILTLFLYLITNIISADIILPDNSLLMVHALFRHGERTTESFYPTDPYINETFYPIGKGGLTNRGKQQEFELGQFLRQRYDKFLGKVYTNEIMKVRSTGFLRTRMSALLVAAGLWPPQEKQIWNAQLPWLAIPVDYKPYEEDDLLNPGACPKRIKVLKEQFQNEDVRRLYITPHKDLMSYLEKNSGKPMRTPADISELYLILKTEEDTNYTLPSWTKSIYPEPIHTAASKVYKYFNFNPEIRKINAGYFLKKILNDFQSKINKKDLPKIYLYSGHESTLGHILDALKVEPHVSEYGSLVLFELHKTNLKDNYVLQILYKRKLSSSNLEPIIYPGCEKLCSVSTFQELIKNILPTVPYNDACKI